MSLDGAAAERRGTIQSVDRAARILKVLGRGSARLGVTEIAEQLGLAKGTAYGLLRTLEAQGMVEQDPDTDKYRLGAAMLQLGNAFLDNHELRGRSLLWADSLASRVGEAVRVGVLNGSTVAGRTASAPDRSSTSNSVRYGLPSDRAWTWVTRSMSGARPSRSSS